VQRGALRYTPAGLPALDLVLKHESTVTKNGQPRKVSVEMRAQAVGEITAVLAARCSGQRTRFAGFLTSSATAAVWLFHVTEVELS
jgi:primosomal replication protein N